jgi:phage major head subunit gpT-like protein
MITNLKSITHSLNASVRTIFNLAMLELQKGGSGSLSLLRLATEIPSTRAAEVYPFLGDVPAVQEWLGDRPVGKVDKYDWTVKNRDFINAIDIDTNTIEDDNFSLIMPKTRQLAEMMMSYKGVLISELIENGITGLAYDGEPFFANRTKNDNLLVGTGVSSAQIRADLSTARTTMMRFKSDSDTVMHIMGNTIVCPPELETLFNELVKSTQVLGSNGGTYNPWSGWITDVIADPKLSDSNDWYLFDTSRSLRPFLLQVRKQPTLVIDDTKTTMNRTITYSAQMRAQAAYGLPMFGVKIVNT